jgi:hypothetical protein
VSAPAAATGRRQRVRVSAYALLLALAVAASDMASMPADIVTGVTALVFIAQAWCQWAAAGLLIAAFADHAVPRWTAAPTLAATVLVVAPLASGVSFVAGRALFPVFGSGSFAHHLWTSLFFSLLVVIAHLGIERVERTRYLLGAAELARSRAETDAAAAQLQALRGPVDPALMLRVMTEVQQRYARDPVQADRLLDTFVTFLRTAMPAVRSGTSNLAAEVAVLRAYAALVSRLDDEHPGLTLVVEGAPPEAAFPPLALLMLIDRLARATGAAPQVRVACGAAQTTIELHALPAPGWLDDDAVYRLRVGLSASGGHAWQVHLCDSAGGADARPVRLVLSFEHGAEASQTIPPAAPGHGASSDPGDPPWTTPALTTPTAT